MKKLLFVIDYQNDFIADSGKLTVGKTAQLIEAFICDKIKSYKEGGHKVFFTLDAHSEEDWTEGKHPEGAVFKPHCVAGSDGYNLYGRVKDMAEEGELINKRAYCPDFSDERILAAVKEADAIEVCGVVTDICVFQTVLGIYTLTVNNGLDVTLSVDSGACASFDADREAQALTYMKEVLGVTII